MTTVTPVNSNIVVDVGVNPQNKGISNGFYDVSYYSNSAPLELAGILPFHKSSKHSNRLLKVSREPCMIHIHKTTDKR